MNEQDIIVKPIMASAKLTYNDDWITLFNEIVEIIHNQSSIINKKRYDIELAEGKEYRLNKIKSLNEHHNDDLYYIIDNERITWIE